MKSIKRIAALFIALTLLCAMGVSASARGSYLGQLQVVNCSYWVTLRKTASTGGASVARVPLGAWVDGYYYNSQFTECYYNGMHGYILSTYLSNGSAGSQSSASSDYLGKRYIVNCNEFVTLRKKPSTSSATVTKVAKGQQVDAYYYNGTFCRCYYNGLEGYILSKYLGSSKSGSSSTSSKTGSYMGDMTIVNCNDWVTLRSKPSTSASTVTRINWGEIVEAYYYNSQFAECYYMGLHGYILLKYLG